MLWVIVLLAVLGVLGFVIWPMTGPRSKVTPRNASPEEIEGYARDLRDTLERRPFGEALARDVWHRLMRAKPHSGVIYDHHRDFCGQGLIRTEGGVMLCDVQDGGGSFGEPIAAWSDEDGFVAFFARQSDYSCSGWDSNEPVFFTSDSWYRNNQRLRRDVLERYLATGR